MSDPLIIAGREFRYRLFLGTAGYPNRKRLAPGVTTPQMDRLVEKALANGGEAAKVCGAGGGGCIAFLCAEGRKADVERALMEEDGAEGLEAFAGRVDPGGAGGSADCLISASRRSQPSAASKASTGSVEKGPRKRIGRGGKARTNAAFPGS